MTIQLFRGKRDSDNFWATRGKRGEDISQELVEDGVVEAMEEPEYDVEVMEEPEEE